MPTSVYPVLVLTSGVCKLVHWSKQKLEATISITWKWKCLSLSRVWLFVSPPGSSTQRNSPGKNTGVGCHSLFQGIFPIRGLSLHADSLLSELPGTHKFPKIKKLEDGSYQITKQLWNYTFSPKLDFSKFCLAYGAYERQFFTFINQIVAIFNVFLPSAYFCLVCSGKSHATVPHSLSSKVLSNFPFLLES